MVALQGSDLLGALRRANACIAINECAWTDAMAALRFENYTRRDARGHVARSSRVHWWRQHSPRLPRREQGGFGRLGVGSWHRERDGASHFFFVNRR
jgi:hypothetical protein